MSRFVVRASGPLSGTVAVSGATKNSGLKQMAAALLAPGTTRLRNMTLMMVTTESEQSQIVRALASGAHEYVIKPFTPDAIIDKLHLLGLVPNGVAA